MLMSAHSLSSSSSNSNSSKANAHLMASEGMVQNAALVQPHVEQIRVHHEVVGACDSKFIADVSSGILCRMRAVCDAEVVRALCTILG